MLVAELGSGFVVVKIKLGVSVSVIVSVASFLGFLKPFKALPFHARVCSAVTRTFCQ